MKRKILAILTTACLVLTMFPVAAFAGTPTPATWSNAWWGDNCLSDNWYVVSKIKDNNEWYYHNASGRHDGSDHWINYRIESTRYENPGFWHSIEDEDALDADNNQYLTSDDLIKVNPFEWAAKPGNCQCDFGAYLEGGPGQWHHDGTFCIAQAKVVKNDTGIIYFHDIDNAIKFVYNHPGIIDALYPIGDAVMNSEVLGKSALINGSVTSDTWTLNGDVTLDLSEATSDTWTLDKDIIVPEGKTLTVKGGNLDLNGNSFDVEGSLVIDEGVVVAAGSDSWAITTGENANVTVNGQLNAAANGIKADKGAKVTINGVLDAADKGIQAAKDTTVTVNGALEAGEIGIEATDATVNVKGELFAGVNGITASGMSKVTVDGDVLALRKGIVANGCSQVDINTDGMVVSISGLITYDNLPDKIKAKLSDEMLSRFNTFIDNEGLTEAASDGSYVGVEINDSAKVNIAGMVMGQIAVLQNGVSSVLKITSGVIAGFYNAIVVNNGFFSINAEDSTLVISEKEHAIVLNKGAIVPSITADKNKNLEVIAPATKQAVLVNPKDAFFFGGFISAGFYSSDVNDKYIKTGFQTKLRANELYEVVPCTTITDKSVSLGTYVVNFVNGEGNTPRPDVYVNGKKVFANGKMVDAYKDVFKVEFKNADSVGRAMATVTAIGDDYKGEGSKSYYVNGPVTPGTVLDPDQRGCYTVKVIGNHFVYNGQQIRPLVTVKFGSLIVNPLDYTVKYENNINAGTAKVIVTSRANVEVVASSETAPKFTGETYFKIEKRNLYIIPNSYTKKLDGQALKFDASAYGFILKDKDAVEKYIDELQYNLFDQNGKIVTFDAAGKIVASGEIDKVTQIKVESGLLLPGSYQIAAVKGSELDNYNIIISAKGKLVILDANGKAPVIGDFNGTGNSLLDMINKSIQKAAGTLGDAVKDTVVQPVKVIGQLERAVERAQNIWVSINKKLNPFVC